MKIFKISFLVLVAIIVLGGFGIAKNASASTFILSQPTVDLHYNPNRNVNDPTNNGTQTVVLKNTSSSDIIYSINTQTISNPFGDGFYFNVKYVSRSAATGNWITTADMVIPSQQLIVHPGENVSIDAWGGIGHMPLLTSPSSLQYTGNILITGNFPEANLSIPVTWTKLPYTDINAPAATPQRPMLYWPADNTYNTVFPKGSAQIISWNPSGIVNGSVSLIELYGNNKKYVVHSGAVQGWHYKWNSVGTAEDGSTIPEGTYTLALTVDGLISVAGVKISPAVPGNLGTLLFSEPVLTFNVDFGPGQQFKSTMATTGPGLKFTNTSNLIISYVASVPNIPSWWKGGNSMSPVEIMPGDGHVFPNHGSIPIGGGAGTSVSPYVFGGLSPYYSAPGTYKYDVVLTGNFVGSPITVPITMTIGGTSSTPPPQSTCSNLYWIDSSNTSCQAPKQFCGMYMYQGLQTFSNQQSCFNAVPSQSPTPTPIPTPMPLPPVFGCLSGNIYNTQTGLPCANNTGNGNQPPVTTPSYNFGAATLRNGSRGEAVMELQRFLNAKLNLGLVVDGRLGPLTIAVVKEWQGSHNLVADGLIGPKTKAQMLAEVN